jgi:iron(III) transport system ATP-binding protein
MRYLLKDIQRELNITGVYVTHDQAEAMGLGDELLVMNEGRIEQRGTARALYGEPRTRFVADFIGVANFLEGELVGPVPAAGAQLVDVKVGASGSGIEVRCRKSAELGKQAVSVLVRPEWVEISIQRPTAEKNVLSGVVRTSQYLGDRTEMLVQTPVGDIRANVGGDGQYPDGSKVFLQLDGEKCIALPK